MDQAMPNETEETAVLSEVKETPALAEAKETLVSDDAAKMAELRQKLRRWRRICRCIMLLPAVVGGLVGLWFFLDAFGVLPPLPNWFLKTTMIFNMGLITLGMPVWGWRNAVKQYHSQFGLEAIGLIVEGLPLRDTKFFAQTTLTTLLPRLQATNAHLLTPRHHVLLNAVLNRRGYFRYGAQKAFVLAILKAYEQIGEWKMYTPSND